MENKTTKMMETATEPTNTADQYREWRNNCGKII